MLVYYQNKNKNNIHLILITKIVEVCYWWSKPKYLEKTTDKLYH